jgi:hypothetical protein
MPTTTITINVKDSRDVAALKLFEGARSWSKGTVEVPGVGRVKCYGIPSRSEPGKRHLTNMKQCSCPDFQFRQDGGTFACAHIRACRWYVNYVRMEQRKQAAREVELQAQEATRVAASSQPVRKARTALIEAF